MLNIRIFVILLSFLPVAALADNVLHPGAPSLDRATLTAVGIQLPIGGDDNYNATVTVRYRKTGTSNWNDALPLYRVHPESVLHYVVQPQFAGSILDLRPSTSYDVELRVSDPDGPVNQTITLTAATRAIPGDPATPRNVTVTDAGSLSQALSNAQPGDVITLANGFYSGQFSFGASGTEANPIVIRGASQDGVIVDGAGCYGCNVFEVYGSYVHIERLTIQNGERAIRFQASGARGNVVRRVHTRDTQYAVGCRGNQLDSYIADNIFEGRLHWPFIYEDDNGGHSDDDGVRVEGYGHVVAHNRISGFGDAMKTAQTGARSVDFYGNDILWSYDNGLELDFSEGNVRVIRNRFTNTYETISGQPVLAGPAYIIRNQSLNTVAEQLKLHSHANPTQEPNGVFAYHNSFVSAKYGLSLQTPTYVHHFAIENNFFIGPPDPSEDMTVDWYSYIDDGLFDFNGYWPDRYFAYLYPQGRVKTSGFAQLQAAGIETHGTLLNPQTLASGLVGPSDYTVQWQPQDLVLSPNSAAIDRGLVLPNVNDGYTGAAPDLGALEAGCPVPVYGPRPEGMDESNEPVGCSATQPPVSNSIAVVGGDLQAVALNRVLSPLQVKVVDGGSNPVAGATVTFTAPGSGASVVLGGSTSLDVITNSQGIATAQATANNVPGSYTVTASITGSAAPALFHLTNVAAADVSLTAPSSIPYSPSPQILRLTAKVSTGGVPVTTGSVVFRLGGTGIGNVPLDNGTAALDYTVRAGTPAGVFMIFNATYAVPSAPEATSSAWQPVIVTKAKPEITWNPPAALQPGAPLTSLQLNATASVPGMILYTPPVGTVLPSGTGQTLSALFVPFDSANYSPASATTHIDVVVAPALIAQAVVQSYPLFGVGVQAQITNPQSAPASVIVTGAALQGMGSYLFRSRMNIAAGGTELFAAWFPGIPSNQSAILVITGTANGEPFTLSIPVVIP